MILFRRDFKLLCASDYKDLSWEDIQLEMRKLQRINKPILLILDDEPRSRSLIENADLAIRFNGENGLSVQVMKARYIPFDVLKEVQNEVD